MQKAVLVLWCWVYLPYSLCACTQTQIPPAVLNSTQPPNGNLTAWGSVRYQYTHQNQILLWEQFIDLCILLSLGLLFNYFYPLRWKRHNGTSKTDEKKRKVACFNFFPLNLHHIHYTSDFQGSPLRARRVTIRYTALICIFSHYSGKGQHLFYRSCCLSLCKQQPAQTVTAAPSFRWAAC